MEKKYDVRIDFQACKECGYCQLVCGQNVYAKGTQFNGRGYRSYQAVNPEACVGCNKCFYACPDFAISITDLRAVKERRNGVANETIV
jgi:NAD-dependent dihydropyrimidine dehydrogenase PreA subunit